MRPYISDGKLRIEQQFVTRDNIDLILSKGALDRELDLLSIDVDGNDYWIWDALKSVRSRVVVIEYYATWFPPLAFTVAYQESFRNTNDETPFAASFFFRAGQTSLRHRVMAASSRCVARSSGRCGVQSMDFNIRETCALWYVTLNSHSITLATRSQVQTPPRKPYASAPALSNSGSRWSCSGVRRGLAPLRGLASRPSSPCSCAIFIHLLTAVLLTESASATSSCVQPSCFSSNARKPECVNRFETPR